jgi:hypothetical protein
MYWSLEKIIPQEDLGNNQKMRLIKEYLKKIKKEKLSKTKRA